MESACGVQSQRILSRARKLSGVQLHAYSGQHRLSYERRLGTGGILAHGALERSDGSHFLFVGGLAQSQLQPRVGIVLILKYRRLQSWIMRTTNFAWNPSIIVILLVPKHLTPRAPSAASDKLPVSKSRRPSVNGSTVPRNGFSGSKLYSISSTRFSANANEAGSSHCACLNFQGRRAQESQP